MPPVNPIFEYAVDVLGLRLAPKHRDGPGATALYDRRAGRSRGFGGERVRRPRGVCQVAVPHPSHRAAAVPPRPSRCASLAPRLRRSSQSPAPRRQGARIPDEQLVAAEEKYHELIDQLHER